MQTDDQFEQWAALFLSGYAEREAGSGGQPAAAGAGIQYFGITHSACELLRSVDAGGIPAFVTSSLIQIATDNGIAVTSQWSPNEIVDAIRRKAASSEPLPPTGPD